MNTLNRDAISKILDEEVAYRIESTNKTLDGYKKAYFTAAEKLTCLKEENNKLKNDIVKGSVYKKFLENLNKNNVEKFIRFLYRPDFNETINDNLRTPIWFKLIVNYYSNKNDVIEILKLAGINVPDSAYSFRLPIDWDEDEINQFLDNTFKNYVCNGCIYNGNIDFWYETGYWNNPSKSYSLSYSEIPWQFVLRNPILNSEKYCKLMAQKINNESNGIYYSKIMEYQNLDEQNIDIFIKNIDIKKLTKSNTSMIDFLLDNISVITDSEQLDALYDIVKAGWMAINDVLKMPKQYLVKFLKENKKDARSIILNLPNCTKEETINLLDLALD